jgi:hypothetical protein
MAKQNRFASEIYQFASEILASQAKHFGLSCAAKFRDDWGGCFSVIERDRIRMKGVFP